MNEDILAGAILEQAVSDWRSICSHKHNPKSKDFDSKIRADRKELSSIRRFFKSKWAMELSGAEKQTMLNVLAQLEKEYDHSLIKLQIEGVRV